MEIYKLKDEIPIERRGQRGVEPSEGDFDGSDAGEMRITGMKQGVRNAERVNIYINSRYALSLDIAQVVDLKLKVGSIISLERLAELRRASELGKLYQRALEWVLTRPRSERETYDYLKKKVYERKLDAKCIDDVIYKLKTKRYVDDQKFAEWYVENRFVKKGVSQKRLAMELMKKGVAKDIIAEVLGERDDEEEIRKIIARKRARYDDEKLVAYLCRQGFSYDLVKSVVGEGSWE